MCGAGAPARSTIRCQLGNRGSSARRPWTLSLRHLQHYHLDGAQFGPGISLCRFIPGSVTNTSRSRRNVCKAIAYRNLSQPFHDAAVCFEIFLQFTKKETRAPLTDDLTYKHNQALFTQVFGVRKITLTAQSVPPAAPRSFGDKSSRSHPL